VVVDIHIRHLVTTPLRIAAAILDLPGDAELVALPVRRDPRIDPSPNDRTNSDSQSGNIH